MRPMKPYLYSYRYGHHKLCENTGQKGHCFFKIRNNSDTSLEQHKGIFSFSMLYTVVFKTIVFYIVCTICWKAEVCNFCPTGTKLEQITIVFKQAYRTLFAQINVLKVHGHLYTLFWGNRPTNGFPIVVSTYEEEIEVSTQKQTLHL